MSWININLSGLGTVVVPAIFLILGFHILILVGLIAISAIVVFALTRNRFLRLTLPFAIGLILYLIMVRVFPLLQIKAHS